MPRYQIEWRRLRPIWRLCQPELLSVLLDPVNFWTLLGTYEGEPIVFDTWQVAFLRDRSLLRAVEKAPQIGFSWTCALEALHECLMFEDSTTSFVSVDQREASEKVLYARKAYMELPAFIHSWIPQLRDTQDELGFGDIGRPSRLMSIPNSSALRGRRMSVVIDESDFYKDGGASAFRVALGRITRGGRVTIGSTCFGEGTQLDRTVNRYSEEDEEEEKNVRDFSIARLPWTVAQKDSILQVIELARRNLDEADFAEEYECVRGAYGTSTFSPELLRRQQHSMPLIEDPNDWEPQGDCLAGYDVGKSQNPSFFSGFERFPDGVWKQMVLYQPVDDKGKPLELPQQQAFLRNIMQRIRALRVVIDSQGVGAHISQAMEQEFGERVTAMVPGSKPPDKPPQSPFELVTEIQRALEAGEIQLAADREQSTQFRRTKKLAGRIEQPGSRRKTHYDRFWSTTYAWYAASVQGPARSVYNNQSLVVIRTGR